MTGASAGVVATHAQAALPTSQYLAIMASSPSLQEMTRNPFVLRLFVEALPSMQAAGLDLTRITRYDVYSGFVRSGLGGRWVA